MAREFKKAREELYTVEELLEDYPAFRSSFIDASSNISIRQNTFKILDSYCLLDIRNDIKKLVELLTPKDETLTPKDETKKPAKKLAKE